MKLLCRFLPTWKMKALLKLDFNQALLFKNNIYRICSLVAERKRKYCHQNSRRPYISYSNSLKSQNNRNAFFVFCQMLFFMWLPNRARLLHLSWAAGLWTCCGLRGLLQDLATWKPRWGSLARALCGYENIMCVFSPGLTRTCWAQRQTAYFTVPPSNHSARPKM